MDSRFARLASLFLIFAALEAPALAYLDGATGSIILQAIIGAVASGAVYYRLFKDRAKALIARVTGRPAHETDGE